jgi:hypothetical protein
MIKPILNAEDVVEKLSTDNIRDVLVAAFLKLK